jgi:hypothetical protein
MVYSEDFLLNKKESAFLAGSSNVYGLKSNVFI